MKLKLHLCLRFCFTKARLLTTLLDVAIMKTSGVDFADVRHLLSVVASPPLTALSQRYLISKKPLGIPSGSFFFTIDFFVINDKRKIEP